MEMIELCQMVARSLVAEIGPWGNRCVLFGGLIPGLLVPNPEEPLLPHIGTRDVDLAIRIAALGDDTNMYRTLKNNLKALKLDQSSSPSFEWTRMVDGTKVVVELFVPVGTPDQAGNIQRKPIEKSGSDLTALGIYGLDLIEHDVLEIDNEGPLLDGKGIKVVKLRVCGPAMLIALKAWALKERNKTKDGYDVVWTLKAYGPEHLARRYHDAGLNETDFGQQALTYLAECFKTHEHTGPEGWVIESNFEGDERLREMREAAGVVQEFITLVQTLPGRETGQEESSEG
jgi:hypothetical protein